MNFTPLALAIRPDEKLVTIVAPCAFNLILDDGRNVTVAAGVQEAPEVVIDHYYAKCNGARRYVPAGAPVAADDAPQPGDTPEVVAKRKAGRPKKVVVSDQPVSGSGDPEQPAGDAPEVSEAPASDTPEA